MKFIKFRTKHAWGYGKWNYKSFEDDNFDNEVKYFIEKIHDEHDYSEKYRGVDTFQVICPPKDWILKAIKGGENMIEYFKNEIVEYQDKILKYKEMLNDSQDEEIPNKEEERKFLLEHGRTGVLL